MSNSQQTERLLWPSTRTRRRISAQFSTSVNTRGPHSSKAGMGEEISHRDLQSMSKTMGAPFSDRRSQVAGLVELPLELRLEVEHRRPERHGDLDRDAGGGRLDDASGHGLTPGREVKRWSQGAEIERENQHQVSATPRAVAIFIDGQTEC